MRPLQLREAVSDSALDHEGHKPAFTMCPAPTSTLGEVQPRTLTFGKIDSVTISPKPL
jgi:hypothetical protein